MSANVRARFPVTVVEKQPQRMVVIGDVHGDLGEHIVSQHSVTMYSKYLVRSNCEIILFLCTISYQVPVVCNLVCGRRHGIIVRTIDRLCVCASIYAGASSPACMIV